jgi:hypothetical protein
VNFSAAHSRRRFLGFQSPGICAPEYVQLPDPTTLLNEYGPCLILIDEWVAYARQLHDQSDLPAGSFETHFTFAQALTESVKLAKQCLLAREPIDSHSYGVGLWRYHVPIFFGASPWNILAYWNNALTTGQTSTLHGGMKQLWLTEKIMEDEAAYKRLIRLLQLKAHSGNPQRGIKMISCDTAEAELERIGKKIVEDIRGTLYYGGCVKFDPPQVGTVEPQRAISGNKFGSPEST